MDHAVLPLLIFRLLTNASATNNTFVTSLAVIGSEAGGSSIARFQSVTTAIIRCERSRCSVPFERSQLKR